MATPNIYAMFVQLHAEAMGIGNFRDDPNLLDTPRRVENAYNELLRGHTLSSKLEIDEMLQVTFKTTHQELTIVNDIRAVGVCPHHFLPVLYRISVGYIPEKTAIGLSKIPRIVQLLAARAVLQEDLTYDIADIFFEEPLGPKGVAILVTGFHTCMSIRGVRAHEATTTTSAVRGLFLDNDKGCKDEFMRLALHNGGFPWT